MKKFTAIILTLMMVFGLFALTGCGEGKDTTVYGKTDMSKYVTLPGYEKTKVNVPEVTISEEEIDAEIQARLSAATTETQEVTEGTVEKGDRVKISFKGTLEDGTTEDGMNSDGFEMVLGTTPMIDGFNEGLYGATIGKPVKLDLEFPDPYTMNEKLSGKKVTFDVTVLAKIAAVETAYDDAFRKKDSDGKATKEADYRKFIKESLTTTKTESSVKAEKIRIYQEIAQGTEVKELLPEAVKGVSDAYLAKYKGFAEASGKDWKTFIKDTFDWTEKEFEKELKAFAENNVKENMIIYAIAQKEGVVVSDKEYQAKLDEILKESGYETEEAFKQAVGVDLSEYGEEYSVRQNAMMEEAFDKIYDRLVKKA